ncbi:hypothetical protein [Mangrovimonas sp. YM274]|uniref:hypothetical protein n=1 Tax=Mangrovimonas sp. YM274 TaxID=3070660 RepID=UPI0027DC7EF4|nr:hypothetical protein [Mangrovimonas sp. YM274]WMI70269.1 hypothetical protein RBH95_07920 [Mangrovimonas sp. YM274]
MSYLKDIIDAPEKLKSFIAYLIPMPFWYVAFFLFNKELYLSLDLFTLSCFAFCFNILSSCLYAWITMNFDKIDNTPEKKDRAMYDFGVTVISVAFQVLLLGIWIAVSAIISHYTLLVFNLKGFLGLYFGFTILLIIITSIGAKQVHNTTIKTKDI